MSVVQRMVRFLPQWMQMRQDASSVGQDFLEATGIHLDDVTDLLDGELSNWFINTANLAEVDLLYRFPIDTRITSDDTLEATWTLDDDNGTLTIQNRLRDFYADTENPILLDFTTGLGYVRNPYDTVIINSFSHMDLEAYHVWNAFDEFGLLIGLPRLPLERNAEYKARLKDVFRHPPGAHHAGLQASAARELGLEPHVIGLRPMADLLQHRGLLDEEGAPTPELRYALDTIKRATPMTWDQATWGQSYWDIIEPGQLGLYYLPRLWSLNVDPYVETLIEPGTGPDDDLKVLPPEPLSDEEDFTYSVGLHGWRKTTTTIYPRHKFTYRIRAQGTQVQTIVPVEEYYFTVLAAERIPINYRVTAEQIYPTTTTVAYETGDGRTYVTTGGPELKPGNRITSPTNRYVEVKLILATTSPQETPVIDWVKVHWINNVTASQVTTINSQAEWLTGTRTDVTAAGDGSLKLSGGQVSHMIDSEAEWQEGSGSGITYTNDGKITLAIA